MTQHRDSGQPLKFANVVILGTQWGPNARDAGAFTIPNIPVGTYSVKASFVGYDPQTITDVQVDAGKPTQIQFKLKKGLGTMLETVKVTGQAKAVDVRASDVTHVQTDKEFLSLPVESVTEAVALNTGVVYPANLELKNIYRLHPGQRWVEIETVVKNTSTGAHPFPYLNPTELNDLVGGAIPIAASMISSVVLPSQPKTR